MGVSSNPLKLLDVCNWFLLRGNFGHGEVVALFHRENHIPGTETRNKVLSPIELTSCPEGTNASYLKSTGPAATRHSECKDTCTSVQHQLEMTLLILSMQAAKLNSDVYRNSILRVVVGHEPQVFPAIRWLVACAGKVRSAWPLHKACDPVHR